jgi:hypothetical protein
MIRIRAVRAVTAIGPPPIAPPGVRPPARTSPADPLRSRASGSTAATPRRSAADCPRSRTCPMRRVNTYSAPSRDQLPANDMNPDDSGAGVPPPAGTKHTPRHPAVGLDGQVGDFGAVGPPGRLLAQPQRVEDLPGGVEHEDDVRRHRTRPPALHCQGGAVGPPRRAPAGRDGAGVHDGAVLPLADPEVACRVAPQLVLVPDLPGEPRAVRGERGPAPARTAAAAAE